MNNVFLYVFLIINCFCGDFELSAGMINPSNPAKLWDDAYQKDLMTKVGRGLPELVTFPFFRFPNENHEIVEKLFSNGKILVFGYGSLMNKVSAARSVKQESVDGMQSAIAFGVKRIFNYKAKKTDHWGANQHHKEKAMLNLVQTFNISSMANGVVIEVDAEDLGRLVQRETGYDLVPILVANWSDVLSQNPDLKMVIAYTFVATNELRNHLDYTSTEFYPVRGYLHAVQEAAATFGEDFAQMWNETTFLADGTTTVSDWDQLTFIGILRTGKP